MNTRTSVEERARAGSEARKRVPRSSHAEWVPARDRFDASAMLEAENTDRLEWLVPVRRARMLVSPFAFYRSAAGVMAADLAPTPVTGLTAQLIGDAHLSNFGLYASPERRLVFDANDFDETLDGPWDWDVKRLAASFMIAAQHRELGGAACARVTARSVESYREAMTELAGMRTLDVWYDHLSIDDLREIGDRTSKGRRRFDRVEAQARSRHSLQALRKLTVDVDGEYRFRSAPPLLFPLRELPGETDPAALEAIAHNTFEVYRATLADDRRHLLDRFRLVDIAVKVVGVGSVGTRCLVLLLEGRDREDPLMLQVKEATTSALEQHLAPSPYENRGQRVVEGQRLMQAASDIFLGWTASERGRDFYVRQLLDGKASYDPEAADVDGLFRYAGLCGWTLARAHARSGDAVAIAAYLGRGDTFDRALTTFAERYATQNRQDYDAFAAAVRSARLPVATDS